MRPGPQDEKGEQLCQAISVTFKWASILTP
jgi:hypothetical protein